MFGHKSFLRIGALGDSSICTKTVMNLKIAISVLIRERTRMANRKLMYEVEPCT